MRRYAPPDPRPGKADAQAREARQSIEKDIGGFDWTPVVILGVMGATTLFSFDRAIQKHEKRHEEREEDEKRAGEDKERRRKRREERRLRGGSEERSSRARSLDDWSEDERDSQGYSGRRRASNRGRSVDHDRGDDRYDRYDRYDRHDRHDRGHERGYSVDYDRYQSRPRRETTW